MEKKYAISLLILFWSSTFWGKAQTVIKMEKSGGVYKIPCKVNGLALKFIFDSGASDVSISLTEALFMLKNEYLSENDIIGKDYHQNANGDIQEGTKVNIRCIEVGGQKIYNVKASVTNTADAPLLFGQSALQRFGKFSIDYSTNTLYLGGNGNNVIGNTETQPTSDKAEQKICKDIEGNTYKTVKIREQIWMAENLKTSHFRDGSIITEIEDSISWGNIWAEDVTCTPAWCYYKHNAANNATYGKLYNWYTVVDSRNVCPTGWHMPTNEEFQLLINYLGGEKVAAGKMKSTSSLWSAPNIGADNSSGFTALPGGGIQNGVFGSPAKYCAFWTSSLSDGKDAGKYAIYRDLDYSFTYCYNSWGYKCYGYSVRCVGD